MYETGYECISCFSFFKIDENLYNCPKCNSNLQIKYDYEKIKAVFSKSELLNSKDFSHFRYLKMFPVETPLPIPRVGYTPLYHLREFGKKIGFEKLYIKDETKNPSCSLKDRASSVFLSRAAEMKSTKIVGASTGNAGSSLACLSAPYGIKPVVIVPASIPPAKLTQLLVFGANVIKVNGSYDDAYELSLEVSKKYGFYNRNTGYNPFTREGKKSVSFEISEELNWSPPDYVFVPVGDGNILSAVWKGFVEFKKIGFIERLPKLIAVQAENSSSIATAFKTKSRLKEVSGVTVADSIGVKYPRDGEAALKALKESFGNAITLTDDEILKGIKELSENTGLWGEPSAVASFVGAKKALAEGLVKSSHKIVILLTGSGLKDLDSAMKKTAPPVLIENDISEIDKLYKKGLL